MCILHCAFLLLLLTACVSERIPSRSSPAAADRGRPIPRTETHHNPESLVSPVPEEATVRSRVRLAVRPLGSIEYDGQVLPLVSPDGRFIAASTGAAPSWPALLGEPGASPPPGARIVIYENSDATVREREHATDANGDATVRERDRATDPDSQKAPPAATRREIRRAHEVQHAGGAGLILGRSATDRAFIVESPRPDGARWIGLVDFAAGRLEWLVRDDAVNAHAVLDANGALAFTRRKTAESPAKLILRPGAGAGGPAAELTWRSRDERTDVAAPAFASDGALCAFLIHHEDGEQDRGIELVRFTLDAQGLAIDARIHLSASTSPLWIHQALAPMTGSATTQSLETQPSLTFFHPDRRNIVTWLPGDQALLDWAEGSIAWAPAGRDGAFLTTAEGLVYQPYPAPSPRPGQNQTKTDLNAARALATPGIPRTTASEGVFLLLAPAGSDRPRRLDLVEFRIPPEPAPEPESAPPGP